MISIIIPTYKNKQLLLSNLSHNVPFFGDCEIVVINDDPDESLKVDLQEYPQIHLIENHKNLGFSPSMNLGVKASSGEYLFFLNNDVLLRDASFLQAVEYLKTSPNTFAVTFAQVERDNTVVGKNRIYWENGFFHHASAVSRERGLSAWAECGSCIVDRKKFLEIGGFDEMYAPFYWEDVDLSYRAYKRGYDVQYNPLIVVNHEHESTTGKFFSPDQVKMIAQRNQMLFIWNNISDSGMVFSHIMALVRMNFSAIVRGNTVFLTAFIMALGYLPQIFSNKSKQKQGIKCTDQEIISQFQKVT